MVSTCQPSLIFLFQLIPITFQFNSKQSVIIACCTSLTVYKNCKHQQNYWFNIYFGLQKFVELWNLVKLQYNISSASKVSKEKCTVLCCYECTGKMLLHLSHTKMLYLMEMSDAQMCSSFSVPNHSIWQSAVLY